MTYIMRAELCTEISLEDFPPLNNHNDVNRYVAPDFFLEEKRH